jgi:hypothetical protein
MLKEEKTIAQIAANTASIPINCIAAGRTKSSEFGAAGEFVWSTRF